MKNLRTIDLDDLYHWRSVGEANLQELQKIYTVIEKEPIFIGTKKETLNYINSKAGDARSEEEQSEKEGE